MYPKRVKLFIPWSKAMVAGATVDKPSYGTNQKKKAMTKRRKRRRKKRHHGSKD